MQALISWMCVNNGREPIALIRLLSRLLWRIADPLNASRQGVFSV